MSPAGSDAGQLRGRAPTELDPDILRDAQRGDDSACRTLVVHYQHRIFTELARQLPARAERAVLEQLAEEIFVEALRTLHRFSSLGAVTLTPWLCQMATRRAEQWHGATAASELPDPADPASPATASAAPTAEPPQDFAERVLAARSRPGDSRPSDEDRLTADSPGWHGLLTARPHRATTIAAGLVAAACAAGLLYGMLASPQTTTPGAATAVQRPLSADETQRIELIQLRRQVAELRRSLRDAREDDGDDRPDDAGSGLRWLEPARIMLRDLAERCRCQPNPSGPGTLRHE
ncbi:MAG: hypothetical protein AAGC55_05420 [Myxococcota bacterium]